MPETPLTVAWMMSFSSSMEAYSVVEVCSPAEKYIVEEIFLPLNVSCSYFCKF